MLVVVLQVVPYGRNHTNPPVTAEPQWDSAQTRALFSRACADCHNNQTKWPWYSNVAPVSWLVQRDVEEGRAVFNVSEWGRPENEGGDAAEELQEGEMPLWAYTFLHPEARLTGEERRALTSGLIATFGQDDDDDDDDG